MKRILILSLFISFLSSLFAQSDIRFNNYWDKTFIINPASINDLSLMEFSMASRKQWVGFSGAPTTFFASGTIYIEKLNTQFGLRATQDKIGYTSTSDIDFTYAYSLELEEDWRWNMGVGLSYQSLSYDLSMITYASATDPTVYSRLVQDNNFNSNLGFELVNRNWRLGASSKNIFSLFLPINTLFTNTNFLYGIYRQNKKGVVNLGFGACGIQYANIYQMELNVTSYFKLAPDLNGFNVGMIYRTWNEMGAIFGMDLSRNLKMSYSYDFNLSGVRNSSTGSHEIMLTYRLNKPSVCINCDY